MAKSYTWTVDVNGEAHIVIYTRWKNTLTVNGQQMKLKPRSLLEYLVGLDQPVPIGAEELRFTSFTGKPDLAHRGIYLNSGKPYVPLSGLKPWAWVFIVPCLLLLVVGFGGAIPMMVALLSIYLIVRIALSPAGKTAFKVVRCTLITVAAWLVYLLLVCLAALR